MLCKGADITSAHLALSYNLDISAIIWWCNATLPNSPHTVTDMHERANQHFREMW